MMYRCPACHGRRYKCVDYGIVQLACGDDALEMVSYLECSKCGLIRMWPPRRQEALDRSYESMWQPTDARPSKCYESVVEHLKSPTSGGTARYDSAYDLGGRIEHVVGPLKETGLCRVAGAGWLKDSKWDVVTCLHVLEHVADVPTFIDRLVSMVGHLLVVEVPDLSIPTHSVDAVNRWHLWHWTPRALEFAIPLYCIEMKRVVPSPGWPSLRATFIAAPAADVVSGFVGHLRQIRNRDERALDIIRKNPNIPIYGASQALIRLIEAHPEVGKRVIVDKYRRKVLDLEISDPSIALSVGSMALLAIQQISGIDEVRREFPGIEFIELYSQP